MTFDASNTVAANDTAALVSDKPKADRVIEIRDIPEKQSKRFVRAPLVGHHADIVCGKSIRLHGIETNRVHGPESYDLTFRVGDWAVYGGFNLTYTGRIISIGEKTVAIEEQHGGRVHRLDIARFSRWNWDYNSERISKQNSEWYD